MTRNLLCAVLIVMGSSAPALAAPDWNAALPDPRCEATAKLAEYLRVDTTNPPGHEAAAADLLGRWLAAEGIAATRFESAPGRVNLVARLPGRSHDDGLMLLHHMDVVAAEASRWKVAPFSGLLRDGMLWGRGAMDMKGMGIMELVTFLQLKRLNVPLARDVIFAAVADEEAGGHAGAAWLVTHHPEAVACKELLNEGSFGVRFPNSAELVGIQTAERGVLWLKLRATGAAGHGSVAHSDSAANKLIRALGRLEAESPPLELTPETRAMLPALALSESGLKRWVLRALGTPLGLRLFGARVAAAEPFLGALLGTTINPTVLLAGNKVNVIPAEAEAELDVRILPGHTTSRALEDIRRTVADPAIRVEILSATEPTCSPRDSRLYGLLRDAVQREYPRATVTPMLSTGGTDSAYFRPKGVAAYGLIPILASREQIETMHGDDERISPAQLAAGTRVLFRTVVAACARE